METIKWQTTAAYVCLVAGHSPWARAYYLRPIVCTLALSVSQKRRCSCGMRLVALRKCDMPLPLYAEKFIYETVTTPLLLLSAAIVYLRCISLLLCAAAAAARKVCRGATSRTMMRLEVGAWRCVATPASELSVRRRDMSSPRFLRLSTAAHNCCPLHTPSAKVVLPDFFRRP